MFVKSAEDSGVHDPLAGPTDLGRKGSLHGLAGFEAVDKILHGILPGRDKGVDGNVSPLRVLQRLQADGLLKVVAGDAAFLSNDDETALGLRLARPWVGVRPPASLEP